MKAFDCVNVEYLCDILYKLGIRGVAQEWIKSFLTERIQVVEIEFLKDKKIHKY